MCVRVCVCVYVHHLQLMFSFLSLSLFLSPLPSEVTLVSSPIANNTIGSFAFPPSLSFLSLSPTPLSVWLTWLEALRKPDLSGRRCKVLLGRPHQRLERRALLLREQPGLARHRERLCQLRLGLHRKPEDVRGWG